MAGKCENGAGVIYLSLSNGDVAGRARVRWGEPLFFGGSNRVSRCWARSPARTYIAKIRKHLKSPLVKPAGDRGDLPKPEVPALLAQEQRL
jgi:hypothetical protein